MKIKLIIILIIGVNILKAQNSNSLIGEKYFWADKDTSIIKKLEFKDNGKFEFIGDYIFDCTPKHWIYGKGKYEIIKDSIQFVFDSIPHLKSKSKIDSIENSDEKVNLKIMVVDQNNQPIENAKLLWGKPKRKRRWITAEFFERQISGFAELEFTNNEKVNFVRIEKEGFYWGEIGIPKRPNKDYNIEVVLRPKPTVNSMKYISNIKTKIAFESKCEIRLSDEIILKKESCAEQSIKRQ